MKTSHEDCSTGSSTTQAQPGVAEAGPIRVPAPSIRDWLARRGIAQKAVAEAAGLSEAAISQVLSGNYPLSHASVSAVAWAILRLGGPEAMPALRDLYVATAQGVEDHD